MSTSPSSASQALMNGVPSPSLAAKGLKNRGIVALLLAPLLLVAVVRPALASDLVQEAITLPAVFMETDGPQDIPLEALVVRPADAKPHPLVVLSHGSPRDTDKRESMAPQSMTREAEALALRGFVTVVVMRRGYGQSGGDNAEEYGDCAHPDYVAAGRQGARDIREAIRLMGAKPFVDPNRVVCLGRSAGGFASVALAADPPPGLAAVINFAGGRGSLEDGEVCDREALVRAFGVFGTTARTPMLWVYAKNDQYFGPDLARAMHQAFQASGGKAELILAPDFGEDGHTLFSRQGIPVWTRYVDDFLVKLGLASSPLPPPAPTAQASPPGALSAKGRKAFEEYLEAPPHKAFAMSSQGYFSWRSGRRTQAEAAEDAREACVENAEASCRVVMLDDTSQ